MSDWPTYPDGRRIAFRELTAEEQKKQVDQALQRYRAGYQRHLMREKLITVLEGSSVDH